MKDLLLKLLKRNPGDRINFEDFLNHPFLAHNQAKHAAAVAALNNNSSNNRFDNIAGTSAGGGMNIAQQSPTDFSDRDLHIDASSNSNSNESEININNRKDTYKENSPLRTRVNSMNLATTPNKIQTIKKISSDLSIAKPSTLAPNNAATATNNATRSPISESSSSCASPLQKQAPTTTTFTSPAPPTKLLNKIKLQNQPNTKNLVLGTSPSSISPPPIANDQELDDYVFINKTHNNSSAAINNRLNQHVDVNVNQNNVGYQITSSTITAAASTPVLSNPMPVPSQVNNYKVMERKFANQIRTPPRSIGSQTEVNNNNNNIEGDSKRERNNSNNSDIAYSISPPTIKFIIGASPTPLSYRNSHLGKYFIFDFVVILRFFKKFYLN